MSDVNVDDTDTSSILYSGSWTLIPGGPVDEFDGTVHSTNENGATATIKFHGTRIVLKCTVPQGTTWMSMQSFLNGVSTSNVTRQSHDNTAFHDDVWFNSTLPDDNYELVIQNMGGPSDSPFQLDRFIVTGSVIPVAPQGDVALGPSTPQGNPAPTPGNTGTTVASTRAGTSTSITQSSPTPSSSSSLSSSSSSMGLNSSSSISSSLLGNSTSVSMSSTAASVDTISTLVEFSTVTAPGTTQTQGAPLSKASGHHVNLGLILGSAIGGALFLIFLLVLLLCIVRRRRAEPRDGNLRVNQSKWHDPFRRMTGITPFILTGTNERSGSRMPPISSPSSAQLLDNGAPSDPLTVAVNFYRSSSIYTTPSASANHDHDRVHTFVKEKDAQLFRDNSLTSNTHSTHALSNADDPAPANTNSNRYSGVDSPILPRESIHGSINAPTYRAPYLSGATLALPSSPSPDPSYPFILPPSLTPMESNDFPPSYQSTRNRRSYPSINVQSPSERSAFDSFRN
ncbi:hypothetical protein CPC08DRAFT_766528 [Agrocybe pediades]|nr:hypothetical protein CPC08DRAFT_766528 [Agrocybe pediades]